MLMRGANVFVEEGKKAMQMRRPSYLKGLTLNRTLYGRKSGGRPLARRLRKEYRLCQGCAGLQVYLDETRVMR